MVEKTQRAEIRKVHRTEEQLRALKFRDVVLASSPEAQRAVAPFLQGPVLRRIVQTIANDPGGDFTKWATNPLVLEHLAVAKKAIDDGLITEKEAEHLILAQVKARTWPGRLISKATIAARLTLTTNAPYRTRSGTRRQRPRLRRPPSPRRGWTRCSWWAP